MAEPPFAFRTRRERPRREFAHTVRRRPNIATPSATSAAGGGNPAPCALGGGFLRHLAMPGRERAILLRRRCEARRDAIAVLRLRRLKWLAARRAVGLGQVLVHSGLLLETQGFRVVRLGDGLVLRRGFGCPDPCRIELVRIARPSST